MDQSILQEQITYYRKRAQEYDEATGQTEGLPTALNALGFVVTVHKLDDFFFFLEARRKAS